MAGNDKQALALANGQAPQMALKEAGIQLGRLESHRAYHALSAAGLAVSIHYFIENPDALKLLGFRNPTDLLQSLGLNLKSANELMKQMETLGEAFMTAADDLQLTRRHLRAARSLPAGEKPEVRGKLLILNGTAFDLEKPKDREKVRDEFEALARARDREAKKAEKEKAEVEEHGDRQIAGLKKKHDALAQQLLDAGFEVGGKRIEPAALLAQSDKLVSLAIAKMTAALDGSKEGKKAFHDKLCAQVIGLCEQLSRQITRQSEAAARQLDEYEG